MSSQFSNKNERGSVFIILMGACILFGALMFTYSRISGSASNTLDMGQAALAYQEINEIVEQHRRAFQRVTVKNGYSIGDVDARYGPSDFTNANCTEPECQIYRPEGGGITPGSSSAGFMVRRKIEASFAPAGTVSWPDQINTARPGLVFSYYKQGTNKADVLLNMPTNEKFCSYFNKRKGINPDTTSYIATSMGFRYQLYANSAGGTGNPDWGDKSWAAPHLQGRPEGCAKIDNGGNIRFWIVAVIYAQ